MELIIEETKPSQAGAALVFKAKFYPSPKWPEWPPEEERRS